MPNQKTVEFSDGSVVQYAALGPAKDLLAKYVAKGAQGRDALVGTPRIPPLFVKTSSFRRAEKAGGLTPAQECGKIRKQFGRRTIVDRTRVQGIGRALGPAAKQT